MLIDGHWLTSHRADPRAYALYRRHYSAAKNAPYRHGSTNIVGPGVPLVLLTRDCDALFVWLRNTVERFDRQAGISCTVFRNESRVRSSDLIAEADDLAWAKWPDQERHFTYVDAAKVRSPNPGFAFKCAGWRTCGRSAAGLVILERLSNRPTGGATA